MSWMNAKLVIYQPLRSLALNGSEEVIPQQHVVVSYVNVQSFDVDVANDNQFNVVAVSGSAPMASSGVSTIGDVEVMNDGVYGFIDIIDIVCS
jgi:hypothetical protein